MADIILDNDSLCIHLDSVILIYVINKLDIILFKLVLRDHVRTD